MENVKESKPILNLFVSAGRSAKTHIVPETLIL